MSIDLALLIVERSGRQAVDARELHEALQVGRVFGTWIAGRIAEYGFVEGKDFEVLTESGKNPMGGRPTKDYALSMGMAKELAMVENNDHGRHVRRYLIRVEEEWRSRSYRSEPAALDMRNPVQLARVAEQLSQIVQEQQAQLAAVAPKVQGYDRLQNAKGNSCLRTSAKLLGFQPTQLIRRLLADKILFHGQDNELEAFSEYLTKGYFSARSVLIGPGRDGIDRTRVQTRVTPKGLQWLASRYPAEDKPGQLNLTMAITPKQSFGNRIIQTLSGGADAAGLRIDETARRFLHSLEQRLCIRIVEGGAGSPSLGAIATVIDSYPEPVAQQIYALAVELHPAAAGRNN